MSRFRYDVYSKSYAYIGWGMRGVDYVGTYEDFDNVVDVGLDLLAETKLVRVVVRVGADVLIELDFDEPMVSKRGG